ncbi:MAG: hypothetical protein HW412_1471 [Bacteroidetes bacterium]|nr:hypothetical protein [Bacteroidota bacterium]
MGQQQILFVILAACIIAVVVSIGVISFTGNAVTDNRTLVAQDLNQIAKRAQEYVRLPAEQGGGFSFYVLSRMPDALNHLHSPSSNANGDFFIKRSLSSSFIQIVGVGNGAGHDPKRPLRLMITVWADRTALETLN